MPVKQQYAELRLLLEHPSAPALLATVEQWALSQARWASPRERAGTDQATHALGAFEVMEGFLHRLRTTYEKKPKPPGGAGPEVDLAEDENWTQGI